MVCNGLIGRVTGRDDRQDLLWMRVRRCVRQPDHSVRAQVHILISMIRGSVEQYELPVRPPLREGRKVIFGGLGILIRVALRERRDLVLENFDLRQQLTVLKRRNGVPRLKRGRSDVLGDALSDLGPLATHD